MLKRILLFIGLFALQHLFIDPVCTFRIFMMITNMYLLILKARSSGVFFRQMAMLIFTVQ
jgi:hypothetical protein